MTVTFDFSGKVALVTGSSSGIGAAIAVLFAKSGARVVVTGRNAKRIADVSNECQRVSPKGFKPLQVVADVTKEDDMKRLVSTTIAEMGQIDVLVNNAGTGIGKYVGIRDPTYMDVYRSVFVSNLTSVVYMTHICVEHLAKSKGNIINISSVFSTMAAAGRSSYCMFKAAVDMFTKCMAIELGPKGIRVNSINPGTIKTASLEALGLTKSQMERVWNKYASKYPVGRVGIPDDIANTVLFIASDASSFTTGSIIAVDGGHLCASVVVDIEKLVAEEGA